MADCINEIEIRIFGLRRSGNHGIINWLGFHAPFAPHFFDCASDRGHSPFLSGKSRRDSSPEFQGLWYPHPSYKGNSPEDLIKIRDIKKEILMYSYEDFNIRRLETTEIPTNREDTVGKSCRRIDVLILRDLVNWLASLLIQREDKLTCDDNTWHNMAHSRFEKNRQEIPYFHYYDGWEKDAYYLRGLKYINIHKKICTWTHYADEIMGKTHLLENPIYILFNKWHADVDYRRSIIERLGWTFTDKGKNLIAITGGGSTFQPNEKHAGKLDLFNRWKQLKHNRIFRDLICYHKKEIEINRNLFGMDFELEEWINNA